MAVVSQDVPKKLPEGGAVLVECEENGGVVRGGFIRKRLVLIYPVLKHGDCGGAPLYIIARQMLVEQLKCHRIRGNATTPGLLTQPIFKFS